MSNFFLTAFKNKLVNRDMKEEEADMAEIEALLQTQTISTYINEGNTECIEPLLETQCNSGCNNEDGKPESIDSSHGKYLSSKMDATKIIFFAHMTTAKADAEILLTQAKNVTPSILNTTNTQDQGRPNNASSLQKQSLNKSNIEEQSARSYKTSSLKRITSYHFNNVNAEEQQDRPKTMSNLKNLTSSFFKRSKINNQQTRPTSSYSLIDDINTDQKYPSKNNSNNITDYGEGISVLEISSCVYKSTTIELEQKSIKDVLIRYVRGRSKSRHLTMQEL